MATTGVLGIQPSSYQTQGAAQNGLGAGYSSGAQFGGAVGGANSYGMGASQLGGHFNNQDVTTGGAAQANASGWGTGYNNEFARLGQQYGNQAAPLANYQTTAQSMTDQNNAARDYQQLANGGGPQIAQAQLASALGQSIAASQAQAASARGGFGLANAQHDAAQNQAQLATNASNQAAQIQANAQLTGMGGLASTGAALEGQNASNAQFNSTLQQNANATNATNAINAANGGANANLGFQTLGNNTGLGYNTLGQNTDLAANQLGANVLGQQLSADVANQNAQNTQMAKNASQGTSLIGGAASALGGLVGGLF
jgi:hypothetical protein